ncbi:MAG: DUF481 domain-containing protein [Acidobacteriota bacterium]
MRRAFPLLLLLAAFSFPAFAHDPDAEPEPDPLWQGTAGLSFLATGGNTDTQSFGVDLGFERLPDPWGLSIVARFNRAEEDGVTTAERYIAGLRGSRTLNDRWSYFAGLQGEQDEFAGIDLRLVAETGVVYNALLGPEHLLSFDLGLTWTDEDRVPPNPDVDFIGGILGLDYAWKISESATFTERLLVYPNFDESDDWRFDSLTALTAALSERYAIQLGYEIRYRNEPIGDNDDTDTLARASLVVNF